MDTLPVLKVSPLHDIQLQERHHHKHHHHHNDRTSSQDRTPQQDRDRDRDRDMNQVPHRHHHQHGTHTLENNNNNIIGLPPQQVRLRSPLNYNYPPAPGGGGGVTVVNHQSPHVLAPRQQPPRFSPSYKQSPLSNRAISPTQSPFVYSNPTRQVLNEATHRRSKTPPRRQEAPQQVRKPTASIEDENKRKIRYIQRIWPSASHYEILKCLQQNDFHVRKTIEQLVDKFTAEAAASEQSKTLMAQSIAYYNEVNRVHGENSPLKNSFYMHLHAQAVEKPQGLSGEELEKYGMLQANDQVVKEEEETFMPAKFVSHIPDQLIPPSGKKKALLIGINYYGSKKELNGCCDDVMRMKKLITGVYGFLDKPDLMVVMMDKPTRDRTFSPTKQNILSAMNWLVADAERGDILFFHFSGHGGQKKDLSGTEIDGFDETIMPVDYKKAGHITDDDIHNVMIKGLKNGVKLISVMDCCHSGSGMDLPFYLDNNGWKQELFPKFSEGDVQLFSSCQDSETAADLMIPSWGAGGAVTLAIVSALSQNPFGWTFGTLLSQIQLFLSERKFTQKPQLSSTQKFDINRSFSFQEITANMNPMIGSHQPKRRRRQKPIRDPRVPCNTRLTPPTPTPVYLERPTYDYQYPQQVIDLNGREGAMPLQFERRESPAEELLRQGAKELIKYGQNLKKILTGV